MPQSDRIVWLKIHSSRLPDNQKLKLEYKRPLIAASFYFESKKESDGPIHVRGEGRLRIPVKGEIQFESSAVSDSESSTAAFSSYTETNLTLKTSREWRPGAHSIDLIESNRPAPEALDVPEGLISPILSPLHIIAALQSSWSETASEYRGLLVAGRRLYAIRLTVAHRTPEKIELNGSVRAGAELLTSTDWDQSSWKGARNFEIDWSTRFKAPTELRSQLPVVGKITLKVSIN